MRSTSNPAFRNLPSGQGGYASFGSSGGGLMGGGAAYADTQASQRSDYGRAGTGDRPITVDDIVQKTAICGGLAVAAGLATALSGLYILALPAFIVGFVVSLVVMFKKTVSPALVVTYSVAMGIALGGIAGMINNVYPGIAFQALVGTAGVFIGMLIVYKTGAVRVTPRFQKFMMGALVGVVVLVLVRLVGDIFFPGNPMSSGGFLSIVISLVIIGVAAFSLLLDFDAADQAVRGQAPAKFAWYIAFGLMTTLVWLYIEILRLLTYLRGD
ncbi:Bax inhibitor-1/YccA family protein [Pseudonocardia endophytica]|uniref:Putative YccA/Bax inhibitor family protein n=1 Tax=Pseudonocardia endophytica TaxID=401976 RepID=A0A4R1HV36_PSEEN|nr:Bax inhibitor-1/YccA family protein [Pseudonocardia endophytica]TCK26597.1 putative YccA/Bax inhibitor family protein [Pseudonocardia endophytica]